MKIILTETEAVFSITIEPENLEEAAKLLRLTSSIKKDVISLSTSFCKNINTQFFLWKRKNNSIRNWIATGEKK